MTDMTISIRVAIVDDHPIFREGIVQTLRGEPDFDVVGQGASAEEAINLAGASHPDLLLLDLTIPGGGLNAARAIAESAPEVSILILTASEDDDDLRMALDIGVRGYVLKGIGGDELVRTTRGIASGETYVPPALAAELPRAAVRSDRTGRQAVSPLEGLSERELQVLTRLANGESNKEIGQQLHLTEKTVKHYVTSILQKLDVRNRVEAALRARDLGIESA
jgi:two-component system, NarL family, nitrate/nitrite response regulator NarL